MLKKLYKSPLLILALSAFLLSDCTKAVNGSIPVSPHPKRQSPYPLSTAEYLKRAKSQTGSEKQESLLSAAGHLIYNGQWQQGSTILAQTKDLTSTQQDEKNLLLATIDMMEDKAEAAETKLSQIQDPAAFPVYQQIQYHQLLAESLRFQKKYLQSLSARIHLETLETDKKAAINNQKALWLTLANIPQSELELLASSNNHGAELEGWFKLALISREHREDVKSLLAALDAWQTEFSSHPANRLLPNPLDSIANKIFLAPKRIALLLPLSGELAGPGQAIRDGFMAAYESSQSKPIVQCYDTNKNQDIAATYQQAIQEGADYVIGPLRKSDVAVVAAMQHPVPTLLLNDSDLSLEDNSYLFGLSPSHEAKQVAMKAGSKGYRNALIIGPKDAWGEQIIAAFKKQWQKNGGQIRDTFLYTDNEDMNHSMQDFLKISKSQSREKEIKRILGQSIQTNPTRRQDFDVIFLLAYPSKARQIVPLLKYYYAGDIPIYATSTVYSGSANALKDKDLDGLLFCDIPWVFSHQMEYKNWPEQWNSYNRLYALGMDSFALSRQLNQLQIFPSDTDSNSGSLYLKSTQQIARVLQWGQFKRGLVYSLAKG